MTSLKRLPATAAFFFVYKSASVCHLAIRYCAVVIFFVFSGCLTQLTAQVSIRSKLCTVLKTDSSYYYEVRIRKGNLTDFSRYQLNLPPEFLVNPVNINSGSFFAADGTVKVTWAITPPEAELQLSFNLHTGTVTG